MPASSAPSKKSKKGKSVGGFLENLAGDAKDIGVGIVTGTYALGKSAVHDAGDYLDGGSHNYQLDDIGRGIASSYKKAYSPLASGDYRTFWNQFYKHPGNYLLDLTGAASGVGSLAGAAGRVAVGANVGAKTGAKLAGLRAVDDATFQSLKHQPGMRPLATSGGGRYLAKTAPIKSRISGEELAAIPLPRNAASRVRVRGREAAYRQLPKSKEHEGVLRSAATYFEPDRRGKRIAETPANRKWDREAMADKIAARGALRQLSKHERTALFYRLPGVTSATRLAALVQYRKTKLAELAQVTDPKQAKAAKLTTRQILADLEVLADKRVVDAITQPNAKVLAAQDILHTLGERVNNAKITKGIAPTDVQMRQRMVLDAIGVTPDEGEKLTVVSYSMKPGGKGKKSGATGLVDPKLGSDKKSTGKAFAEARYKHDPAKIIESFDEEIAHLRVVDRFTRAIETAAPFDPEKHAAGVARGDLKIIGQGKDAGLAVRAVDFLEQELRPLADDVEGIEVQQHVDALKELFDGEPKVMSVGAHKELVSQLRGADGLISKLTKRPTATWRTFTLSLKGSFYVNNFLGNLILSVLAYGPRGVLAPFGAAAYGKGSLGRKIDESAADLKRTGFAVDNADAAKAGAGNTLVERGVNNVGDFIVNLSAKGTENNFRRGAFALETKRFVRQYRKNERAQGNDVSFDDAVDAIFNDPDAVDQIAERVYGNMLDYSKLTPLERDKIRPVYPFWNFLRSMTGRTVRLAQDEPWKLVVIDQISEYGLEQNEAEFGELPPHLRGIIGYGESEDGRPRVLQTIGANPLTAPMDAIGQAQGLLGQPNAGGAENPLAAINPFVRAPMEAMFRKDAFLGRDLPEDQSTAELWAKQTARGFPQVAMAERYFNPTLTPAVEKSGQDVLRQYGGLPTGTLDQAAIARQRVYQQQAEVRALISQRRSELRVDAARDKYERDGFGDTIRGIVSHA